MSPNPPPDPVVRRLTTISLIALGLILLIYLLPWIDTLMVRWSAEPRPITPRGDLMTAEQINIQIFDQASPSVVYITTLKRVTNPWTRNVFQVPRGTGSGFVWDQHGDIVTNYHVIQGAQAAQVRLSDQRSYNAVLVGASPEHDLAVLRINVPLDRPVPVPVGRSHDLKVGQKVLAIGNPFGLDHTLTTGIVSALDRTIETDHSTIEHLIQTDAAINPGNSGGPLLDSAGRLVGITTAIYSPSGASAGIGFAVPVDTVNRVVPRLIADGRYIRPSLGVVTDDDISKLVTQKLGVEGVLVLRVQPDSVADASGLRGTRLTRDGSVIPGDIIQSVDGQPVHKERDLTDLLEQHEIGDQVQVLIYRAGETVEIPMTLESSRG